MAYVIEAKSPEDLVRQIAEYLQRAAAAERHHAAIMHKGKKVATERSAYAANYAANYIEGLANMIVGIQVRMIPDRLADECHGYDLDGEPVGPQFDVDGQPMEIDIDTFIALNQFTAEEHAEISALKIGEEMRFGGGAAPITVLRRVR